MKIFYENILAKSWWVCLFICPPTDLGSDPPECTVQVWDKDKEFLSATLSSVLLSFMSSVCYFRKQFLIQFGHHHALDLNMARDIDN